MISQTLSNGFDDRFLQMYRNTLWSPVIVTGFDKKSELKSAKKNTKIEHHL